MYFWYYLQFFILTLKSPQAKIIDIYFSTRKLYILGENTSKYCSRIIVVHVTATVCFFASSRKINLLKHITQSINRKYRLPSDIIANLTIGMTGNKAGLLLNCVKLHSKCINKTEI